MPFKKGRSGNPRGRDIGCVSRENYMRKKAAPYAEEALGTLVKIMRDPEVPSRCRLQAANSILDRGWGRPAQQVETTISPKELSNEELALQLPRALEVLGIEL